MNVSPPINQNEEGFHYFACSSGNIQNEQHTFGEWIVEKEATEEEDGIQTKECSTCHFKLSELIPQKQHFCTLTRKYSTEQCWNECSCGKKYGIYDHYYKFVILKEATEEEVGLYNLSCFYCDYTTTKVIEKLPHTHSFKAFYSNEKHYTQCNCGEIGYEESHCLKEEILQQPTETREGVKSISCTGCKYSTTEVIEKTPHQHSFEQYHNAENHYSKCKCGEIINEEKHNLVSEVIKKATEEEEGQTKTSCTNCSYETTEVIAKIPHEHSYGDIIYTNDNHYKECSCGVKYYTLHYFNSYIIKEATEEEKGILKKYCTLCNYSYLKSIESLPHTFTATDPINDTEHSKVCDCGLVTSDNHRFSQIIIKEATNEQAGSYELKCVDCGFTKEIVIPANHTSHHFSSYVLTNTVPNTTNGVFTSTCECGAIDEEIRDISKWFYSEEFDGKSGYCIRKIDNVKNLIFHRNLTEKTLFLFN